ncbi:MAG: hypothetical protein ACMUJI_07465 [Erythrobacter sp.]|uniref:hypothetical protein n=1 Tax=Erythrobacter sp. TaxID=1042 RepID=UPI003A838B20
MEYRPDPIPIALGKSIIGGSLIGGFCLTIFAIIFDGIYMEWSSLGAILFYPFFAAALSMMFVIPCVLTGGLITALAIRHLPLGRGASLGLCILAALLTQAAALSIVGMGDPDYFWIVALPFSIGASLTLWWSLAPSYPADRPRSQ